MSTRPEIAIESLRPGARWVCDWDDSINPPAYTLSWQDAQQAEPSAAEIAAEIARLDGISPADWQGFRTAFISDSDWATWAGQIPISLALALTTAATLENLAAFHAAYDAAATAVAPPTGARAQWQAIADANNIAVDFEGS